MAPMIMNPSRFVSGTTDIIPDSLTITGSWGVTPSDVTTPLDGNFSTLGDEGRIDLAGTNGTWEFDIGTAKTVTSIHWKIAIRRDGNESNEKCDVMTYDGSWTIRGTVAYGDFGNSYADKDKTDTGTWTNVTKIRIEPQGGTWGSSTYVKVYALVYDYT